MAFFFFLAAQSEIYPRVLFFTLAVNLVHPHWLKEPSLSYPLIEIQSGILQFIWQYKRMQLCLIIIMEHLCIILLQPPNFWAQNSRHQGLGILTDWAETDGWNLWASPRQRNKMMGLRKQTAIARGKRCETANLLAQCATSLYQEGCACPWQITEVAEAVLCLWAGSSLCMSCL